MSSNSVVSLSSFNLLFFTQVLTVLTSTIKYSEYVTDKGKNISIPCLTDGNIMWVKESGTNSTIVQTGKFLVLTNVSIADRGLYVCFASVPSRNVSDTLLGDAAAADLALDVVADEPASITYSPEGPFSTSPTSLHAASVAVEASTMTSPLATPIVIATDTVGAAVKATHEYVVHDRSQSPATVLRSSSSNIPTIITTTKITTTPTTTTSSRRFDDEQEFEAFQKVNLSVRTAPGPVSQLYFKASTILGFLIWRFNKTNSGGYPVRSFTAEFRNVSYEAPPYNATYEHQWNRMDPVNIAPNVRQMEVYRLEPNTTYEFRIWANNQLGSGEVVTTNVTTLPETKEEDLIRLIQPDLDNFDPRVWIIAVSVVLGTLVILAIGLCIVLSKECYQASHMAVEDGWDSIELIPNIILNPGYCDADGREAPYTRTIIFDDDSYDSDSESDHEPRMEKFKRKVSVFFQGPTIKRI